MGQTYTENGVQFNTGTVTLGTWQVLDGDGGTVIRTSTQLVEVPNLSVGTPGGAGVFKVVEHTLGVTIMRTDIDEGMVMGSTMGITLRGTTTPAGPISGTNKGTLYVDAGGAGGKRRLMCQFDTGSAVLIATEP